MEPEVKQETTELQKLQQEYGKLAQIYGDLKYRILCWEGDALNISEQMKTINQKAAELNIPAKPVEAEVVQ